MRNVVLGLIGCVVLFTVLAGVYLDVRYAYTMPREPQPQFGRVFRVVVNHGTVVYVNKEEFDRMNFIEYDLMPISGVGALVAYFIKTHKKHKAKSRN
jgi:hypothetical protein